MDVEIKYLVDQPPEVEQTYPEQPIVPQYPTVVPGVTECDIGDVSFMVLTLEDASQVRIPWSQIRDVVLVYQEAGQVVRRSPFEEP